MSALNIDNTAKSWGEFLQSLADEAARDAASLRPDLALHGILNDLSLVARAYVERVNLERGNDVKRSAEVPVAEAPATPLEAPLDVGEPVARKPDGWLLDTLADMHNRFGALEARIESLEARVDYLERNQKLTSVAPVAYLIESENVDEDPAVWDSIDRARAALRGMVAREHRERAASRQRILERVASLAGSPERDSSIDAEIRQHQARADELGKIDAIAGGKMDEIAGLLDLAAARAYVGDVKKGWPE